MLAPTLLAPHAVRERAREIPAALAVVHVDGDGDQLTYAELLPTARTGRLALGWLRAVEVPLNTACAGKILRHALSPSEATTLVTTKALLPQANAIASGLPESRTVRATPPPDAPA